jgi:hypothetical protein
MATLWFACQHSFPPVVAVLVAVVRGLVQKATGTETRQPFAQCPVANIVIAEPPERVTTSAPTMVLPELPAVTETGRGCVVETSFPAPS